MKVKVKLLVPLSGADGSFNKGEIIEVTENEASRFVEKEYAAYVDSPKETKKAKKGE